MRLSEAIRLGAMLKPQGFSATAYEMCPPSGLLDLRPSVTVTCALGAAADAVGMSLIDEEEVEDSLDERWPFLRSKGPDCPACGDGTSHVAYAITHLNDDHDWTRERIAEWVATIEPAEVQTAEAPREQEVVA